MWRKTRACHGGDFQKGKMLGPNSEGWQELRTEGDTGKGYGMCRCPRARKSLRGRSRASTSGSPGAQGAVLRGPDTPSHSLHLEIKSCSR